MSYSTFFRLGLSLACEPKDYTYTYSYPSPLSPVTPTTPQLQISIQTPIPTQQRPITRRRRSSLTILTSPMSSVKSTNAIRAASEAARVVKSSELEVNVVARVPGETENVPPAPGTVRKIRRRTITAPPPILLSLHHRLPAPPRFPPPTSPLPPTPLSPSFATWSQKNSKDTTDPVLPQTPTQSLSPSAVRNRNDQASSDVSHDEEMNDII